ncbi:MAG: bifunctional metallophosphatase/5'-nucleotidase, partial [Candidatus Sericytochromatia bacterium]
LPFYKGSLITTNMTFAPEVAQRYTVKKIGNVRVGMFALITEVNGLVSAPNFKGARYYDPVKVAEAAVAKLKKECDVIVLLSHVGTVPPYAEEGSDDHEVEEEQITDEKIAQRVPGIDVIVSGHTHVMIKTPKIIRNKATGAKTFIVSSGMGGGFLGKADLTLEKGKVTYLNNEMIPLTASVPNAPDIEQMVSPFRSKMDATIKVDIGEAKGTFKRYGTKDTESTLNNLIADATLWAARSKNPKVDFAVMSSGTPRNHIMAGPISVEDVFYALPFDNKIDIVTVNGKQALEMLTVQRRPTDNKRHSIAGVTYTLLKNFGPIKDVMIGGEPLDLNKTYVVAVNDYMAEGSSGFTMLPGNPRLQTGILQRDALIQYIKTQKVLTPDTGRIKLATP